MEKTSASFHPTLTGTALKYIAIVTMLLDHIGAGIVELGLMYYYDEIGWQWVLNPAGEKWIGVDFMLRGIGRLAFPIFCFLLTEGFLHTRNVKKYIRSLFLLALVSEIPFDLAFFNCPVYHGAQNVFFTLAIGLLTLEALKRFELQKVFLIPIVVIGCGAALLLRTDYSAVGVLLIVSFYLFRNDRRKMYLAAAVLTVYESINIYGLGILALIPISFYNGQRGRTKLKYAFYFFYPVHILLIFLFRYYVLGVGLLK